MANVSIGGRGCASSLRGGCGLAAVAGVAVWGSGVRADLTLTPDGMAKGFSLTTFASGFPVVNGIGPLGIDFPVGGGVMVTDYAGDVQMFQNVDGQLAGNVSILANYGTSNALGLAHVGSSMYMTQQGNNRVVEVNGDGSINRVVVDDLLTSTGIVANPATGHLFVGLPNSGEIVDLDPVGQSANFFEDVVADGLSLSSDAKVLYAAVIQGGDTGHVLGYDTSTGNQVFDSGFIAGGIDGTALGFGPRTGNIYVNTNGGTVVEVDLLTLAQTLIATGGSRGDFVAPDPSKSGDLLVTQSDRIVRLSGIPSPGSATLAVIAGAAAVRRRRRV